MQLIGRTCLFSEQGGNANLRPIFAVPGFVLMVAEAVKAIRCEH
jgi:hypothetical protein